MDHALGWDKDRVTCATNGIPKEIALTLIERAMQYSALIAENETTWPEDLETLRFKPTIISIEKGT